MKDECKQPLKEEGRISLSTTEMEQSAGQHKDAVSRSECTIAISATHTRPARSCRKHDVPWTSIDTLTYKNRP